MELYLDSANLQEIETAFQLGFLTGLTTTPTFMHRDGHTDIDATILKLADMVPILQVEALGETADEIVKEAHRLLEIGLKKDRSVFKIPVSLEGVKACNRLAVDGIMVNVHLVYTLQQAYMALEAGATYVCPLVGRLQDQGHDALSLVEQCVQAVDQYGYDAKIMFSSVRHPEHVRNAINLGVHTCTVPWKVMQKLTENNFTTVGTQQFFEHTRLMTLKVAEVMGEANPTVKLSDSVTDAILAMSSAGLGAVTVVNDKGSIAGVFTDGDLRRHLQQDGKEALGKAVSDYVSGEPLTISGDALLNEAVDLLKANKVDNLIVAEGEKPVGMLDVQDLVKLNLIG